MKEFPKPIDVMKLMHRFNSDAYKELPVKEKGIIQFCLREENGVINCYFDANGTAMEFFEGTSSSYSVKLEATLSDWLLLAEKKLKAPVKGFYTFEYSAHSPFFEEPKKMLHILQKDVLAGTNSLADTI